MGGGGGRVGPKEKKIPASENEGEKIRAASCGIRKKVDKPPKKIYHRQFTGKNIQATQESPTPLITFLMVRPETNLQSTDISMN